MLNYRHVLCAVDFSSECFDVCLRAESIAKEANAHLSLVHVIESMPMMFTGGEHALPVDAKLEESLKTNAKDQMLSIIGQLTLEEIGWHMVEGSIKHGVIDCAVSESCDLIVVGAHGHHGAALFHGGNANAILHGAPCDVLAVHVE